MEIATGKIKIKQIDEPVPFLEHLQELRKRLIYSIIGVIICSICVYPYITPVFAHLTKPAGKLVFIGPAEAFWSRIKLTFFLGVFVSMPLIFFQAWKFIQKGLLPGEKGTVLGLSVISFLLFSIGASFGYFFIVPVGMKFLLAYGTDTLVPMLSVSRYLSFLFSLVFAFGLIFELPLIIGFFAKIGLLESRTLRQKRRFAIVAIFILAAALTPGPDVFSQVLMAGPLLILYEAGIIAARLIERRK